MTSKKPFLGVNIDEDTMRRIDEFRWNNRYQSRAKALEVIIHAGMDALADQYPELNRHIVLETGEEAQRNVMTNYEERIHI